MSELRDDLMVIAHHHNIEVMDLPGESWERPVAQLMVLPNGSLLKFIIMNPNFESPYPVEFQLGHEIGHFIGGETTSQRVYAFSPLGKQDEENKANHWIIDYLAKRMFADVELEQRNYVQFMQAYNLPTEFECVVRDLVYE
jgi:hypothetical protein